MRFNTLCASVALAGVASAVPGWFDAAGQDVIANDADKVPGTNPLTFCNADRSKDLVTIEKVDLNPNPPVPGKTLTINASGKVLEKIEQGAYVDVVVKYGLIKLVSTQVDLCEQTKEANITCPIEKGDLKVTKSVEIPSPVPIGTYNVHADVYTSTGKAITCLDASVTFSSMSQFEL